VIGKGPVELGKEDLDIEGEPLEDLGNDQTAHAVGRIGHHPQPPERADVDERPHVVGIGVEDRTLLEGCEPPGVEGGRPVLAPAVEQRFRGALDLGQPGVATDGTGARPAQLEAVVARRVVGGGEHAPRGVEAAGGEIEEVGGGEAEVDHRHTLGSGAVGECPRQGAARLAHVASHQQSGVAGEAGHRHPDGPELRRIELVGHDSPDVVRLEHVGEAGHGRAILPSAPGGTRG
jgi:hypothetical protein